MILMAQVQPEIDTPELPTELLLIHIPPLSMGAVERMSVHMMYISNQPMENMEILDGLN